MTEKSDELTTWRTEYAELANLICNGEREAASERLERLCQSCPEDSECRLLLADAALMLNNRRRADEMVEAAVCAGTTLADCHAYLSEIRWLRADIEGALEWAWQVADDEPDRVDVLRRIFAGAILLGKCEQVERAARRLCDLLDDDNQRYRLLCSLAESLGHHGRTDEAGATAEEGFGLAVTDPSLMLRGVRHLQLAGLDDQAIQVLEGMAGDFHDDALVFRALGQFHLAHDNAPESIPPLMRAIELDPDDVTTRYLLGCALLDIEDNDRAEAVFAAAALHDPDPKCPESALDLQVMHNLGLVRLRKGDCDGAIEALQKALSVVASTYVNLGLAQYRAGRHQEAESTLRHALSLEPRAPDALDLLANAFMENGQLDQALVALERAIELDPGYAFAHYDMGVALARQKPDSERALECFEQARALGLDNGMVHYAIACIYAVRGETDMALQELEEALKRGTVEYDYIAADPDWHELRADPRFRELMGAYFGR